MQRVLKALLPAAAFIVLSLADLATTLYGIHAGFSEANPILAARLNSGSSFVGSYLTYTGIGAAVVFLSTLLSRFSRGFRAVAIVMVLLKALPVFNNALLLSR